VPLSHTARRVLVAVASELGPVPAARLCSELRLSWRRFADAVGVLEQRRLVRVVDLSVLATRDGRAAAGSIT
jgi:hypothetical protein